MGELSLHLRLMVFIEHVNEVHQNNAAQVSQAQLTGNGLRRLEVDFEHRLGKAAAAHEPTRVDVDNGHGLGLVDYQVAPALEVYAALECLLDLLFDVVQLKEGALALKIFKPIKHTGHVLLGEDAKAIDAVGVINQHTCGLLTDPVPQHTLGQIELRVEHRAWACLVACCKNLGPALSQVGHIVLQGLVAGVLGRGPGNKTAGLVRCGECQEPCLERLSGLGVGNALADANARLGLFVAQTEGQIDQIAARN